MRYNVRNAFHTLLFSIFKCISTLVVGAKEKQNRAKNDVLSDKLTR